MHGNPYVFVIHGTWNPPQPGLIKWYQQNDADPSTFSSVLNKELEARGQGRPVWPAPDANAPGFGSGRTHQISSILGVPARASLRKSGLIAASLRLRAMLSLSGCCLSKLNAIFRKREKFAAPWRFSTRLASS